MYSLQFLKAAYCIWFEMIAESSGGADIGLDARLAFWERPIGRGQWAYKRRNKAVTLSKSNSLQGLLMLSHAWHGTCPDQIQTSLDDGWHLESGL